MKIVGKKNTQEQGIAEGERKKKKVWEINVTR